MPGAFMSATLAATACSCSCGTGPGSTPRSGRRRSRISRRSTLVAQDLPGHGRSSIPRLSVGDAIADGGAVVTDLGFGEPILAGFSLGGWAALHYAATPPGPRAGMPRRPDEPGLRGNGSPTHPSWLRSRSTRRGGRLRFAVTSWSSSVEAIARRCGVDGPLPLRAGGPSDHGAP